VTAPETESLLEVRDLRTWFDTPRGTVRAVDGVSLTLDRGRTLGVVGESGSGKTVLARSIMNLLPKRAAVPAGGEVLFDGRPIRHPAALPGMRDRTVTVGAPSLEQRMIAWRVGWSRRASSSMMSRVSRSTTGWCQAGSPRSARASP
jgi:ABC-type dipeptide/oligopeptide/nickel transport system ATPase component